MLLTFSSDIYHRLSCEISAPCACIAPSVCFKLIVTLKWFNILCVKFVFPPPSLLSTFCFPLVHKNPPVLLKNETPPIFKVCDNGVVLKMTNFLDVTHCPCSIKNTDVPEIGISSVNWAQQSRRVFLPVDGDRLFQSPKRHVLMN